MNEVIEINSQPTTMTASNAVFNPLNLDALTKFAHLMADSTISVPAHFVGKPADCMAVVMQAMQWGMNPYAVAQKTHTINGVLGYEAQLVNAVISSSNAITGRFHYEYAGDWSKCTKTKEEIVQRPAKGGGTYGRLERVRAWSDADEEGLTIRVGAILRGESEITWGEPIHLSGVVTRNSPLWVSNPKQQIAYLGVKYFGRLYCPEVILGVYTPDEVEQRTEREINPTERPTRASISQMAGGNEAADQPDAANIPYSNEGAKQEVATQDEDHSDAETLAAEIREEITAADTVEKAKAIRADIEAKKAAIGSSLYTELKGKAVGRFHHIDARNAVEAAINSLDVSDPDAKAHFAKAEQLIKARKGHLGDKLYDGFMLTMNDLRVEFQ